MLFILVLKNKTFENHKRKTIMKNILLLRRNYLVKNSKQNCSLNEIELHRPKFKTAN